MKIELAEYPEQIRELLQAMPLAPLGPGKPVAGMRAKLLALDDPAFGRVGNGGMVMACRAGLWLAFDYLEESHELSQTLKTPEGSYWHGILHRREPDAVNASYWFRHVGEHPIFSALAQDARELGLGLRSGRWDPFEFIDLCEQHRDTGTEMEMVLRRMQQGEWERLFAWCYTHSIKGG